MRRPVLLLLLLAAGVAGADEDPPRRVYNRGVAALESSDLDAAEKDLVAARDRAGGDAELRFAAAYDLGVLYAKRAEGLGDKPDEAMAALGESVQWLRDAVRQRPADVDARANLEIVLRRMRKLADDANQGAKKLEARLDALIDEQRGLLAEVRATLAQVAAAGASSDPLAFADEFRSRGVVERQLLAEAGAVAELAAEELAGIEAVAEDQRSDEQRGRAAALAPLGEHLGHAREQMLAASRQLRALDGEGAHRRADEALVALKRAREQLADPAGILRGLVTDQLMLAGQSETLRRLALLKRSLSATEKPPAAPAWLTFVYLAAAERSLEERSGELAARLKAAAAAPAKPDAPPSPIVAVAGEAAPLVEAAVAAMGEAGRALDASDGEAAIPAQGRAVVSLVRAAERFAGVRQLIELAANEQAGMLALLTPDPDSPVPAPTPAERARRLAEAAARNQERIGRLKGLLAAEAEEKAKAESDQEKAEGIRAHYARAEEERLAVERSLSDLVAALGKAAAAPEGLRPPVEAGREHLEALRRLFLSIVEHLEELARAQGETLDASGRAQAAADDGERGRLLAPLPDAETGHLQTADALADALADQAEAARGDAEAAEQAQALAAAGAEVGAARDLMREAQAALTGAVAEAATSSVDLAPALDLEGKALERLEKAIELLQPPEKKKGDQDQDQTEPQQDSAARQAEQKLQQVRDQEAERQRQRQRAKAPPEPVDKDW